MCPNKNVNNSHHSVTVSQSPVNKGVPNFIYQTYRTQQYISLSISLLMETQVVSISWLLLMLQLTWNYRYFFDIMILFLLDKCTEVGLLNHKVVSSIFNFFGNIHTIFHSSCTTSHSHQQCTRVPFSPQTQQYLSLIFLVIDNLTGIR